MSITMKCNGCGATSLGGVLQHMTNCLAKTPPLEYGVQMPSTTVTFDTPAELQKFMKGIGETTGGHKLTKVTTAASTGLEPSQTLPERSQAPTPLPEGEEELSTLEKKLEQDIQHMFDLEAQRNDINFTISGVERGEMTIEDYKKDLSLAISMYVYRDLLPTAIQRAEKAYGGCHNCYGKGYATVNDRWHGHDTDTDIGSSGGYFSGGDNNAMKFCTCDRGKQLEKRVQRAGLKGQAEAYRAALDHDRAVDSGKYLDGGKQFRTLWLEDRLSRLQPSEAKS